MLIILLGVYIVILGLMTLILFQGHRCVRKIYCKLVFWILVLCSLSVVWLLHTLKVYAQYNLCDSGVYSRETINMFFVGQVSWLVENFNFGIYSDIINVINVKLCMMVLPIKLNLFIPLSVTLTIF